MQLLGCLVPGAGFWADEADQAAHIFYALTVQTDSSGLVRGLAVRPFRTSELVGTHRSRREESM